MFLVVAVVDARRPTTKANPGRGTGCGRMNVRQVVKSGEGRVEPVGAKGSQKRLRTSSRNGILCPRTQT